MKQPNIELGQRLKDARMLAGLSQKQVSDLLSIRRPSISEIERGERSVSATELKQFAGLYDVSTDWLLASENTEPASAEIAARIFQQLSLEERSRVLSLLRSLPSREGKV